MGDGQTMSPPPASIVQPTTMSFPDAMHEIKAGNKVARISWPKEDFGLLRDDWLEIFTNGDFYVWKVNDGDIEGEDWVVVADTN